MTIRIWNSYSCNNSSSYRLVARFRDAKTANETADELRTFFTEHAQQMDVAMEDGDMPEEPTEAATALAKKYGFTWETDELLTWGDDTLVGDEPSVTTDDDGVLVIWHTYCGGGYPGEVNEYLKKRGATEVESDDTKKPPISALFRLPKDNHAVRDELTKAFADIDDGEINDFAPPWTKNESYGKAAFFCDGETLGFYLPHDPTEIPALKAWLAERGVENPSIRLCHYSDHIKFQTIAEAKCTSCSGALKYLDSRLHGIETEQLACSACGGMFDLKAFMPPKPPKPTSA